MAVWENRNVFELVGSCSNHVYTGAVFVKENTTCAESEEGVVFAHANIDARSPACAALANDDVTSDNSFAAEFFHITSSKLGWLKLCGDMDDLELGEVTTETDFLVETFAALELEGDAFFSAMLFNNFCGDTCACNSRLTDRYGRTFTDEENVKSNFVANFECKFFHIDFVAFLNAVLFTACFDDCVAHGIKKVMLLRAGRELHHKPASVASFF